MRPEVAVVGANGFIGRQVVRSLAEQANFTVAQHVRRRADDSPTGFDLRAAHTVRAALREPLAVVHAASYVGSDVRSALEVNVEGTRNLLAATKAANVTRVVYVSTAAVYGRGPFIGQAERDGVISPASVLSETRVQAERLVLESGGIVVRPHLVFGAGDRWVLPTISRTIRALGAQIDEGRALHSTIHVRDLGNLLAWLATTPDVRPGVYHACQTRPTAARTLTEWVGAIDTMASVSNSMSLAAARLKLEAGGSLLNAANLLGVDHTFDNRKLIQAGFHPPDEEATLRYGDVVWYRQHLISRRSG